MAGPSIHAMRFLALLLRRLFSARLLVASARPLLELRHDELSTPLGVQHHGWSDSPPIPSSHYSRRTRVVRTAAVHSQYRSRAFSSMMSLRTEYSLDVRGLSVSCGCRRTAGAAPPHAARDASPCLRSWYDVSQCRAGFGFNPSPPPVFRSPPLHNSPLGRTVPQDPRQSSTSSTSARSLGTCSSQSISTLAAAP
ncbi:hypothetical protein MSAN_02452400 [Mycena sanguinolenta]|uniref:Secreted protein n=1 Tax=Mycena sanguinolenta TaxID=230812 RepID=A0A8H7CBB0_9AGAR|nr:hypothetical protein MSAN_02452400 [Mycena sanguinolenta]